jgi:DNA modification methylase
MAPNIVTNLLRDRRGLRVLDPMAGSGTVLALARAHGHRAVGFDIDPLAVLLADVWTTAVDRKAVCGAARGMLARSMTRAESLDARSAYPSGADEETKRFLRYWFDANARKQLAALAVEIQRVDDDATRQVLWCALSRCIITKQSGASRAMDLSHSRPHRAFKRAPALPFDKFLESSDRVLANCIDKAHANRGPATSVRTGDARKLPLPDNSIDLVLTSPPYLNAIDYMRCSKFSLVWMGHTIAALRQVRSVSVGCEIKQSAEQAGEGVGDVLRGLRSIRQLPSRELGMLTRYVSDMHQSLSEAHRVLVPGGRATYVVGDSTVRGTFVSNSAIVSAVARQSGFSLVKRSTRKLPPNRRYLPPPEAADKGAMNARMAREVVLTFEKSKLA